MTLKAEQFAQDAKATNVLLDSVAAAKREGASSAEAASAVLGGMPVPKSMDALLGRLDEKSHGPVLDSILAGMDSYKHAHGVAPDSGLISVAVQQALLSTYDSASLVRGALDSAYSNHHDQLSLQANRAIVSVMSLFSEAMPFANYLPTDIGSNEAKLIIVNHLAGSSFNAYQANSSLNGLSGGAPYMDSERIIGLTTNGGTGPFAGTVAAQVDPANPRLPLAVSGSNVAVKLLRGRSIVYIAGIECAMENRTTGGSGNNAVSGSVTIGATTYAITGTVNSDTGAYSIASAPALPANTVATLSVFVDYEAMPELAPSIKISADAYSLYANASRANFQVSIDAETQFRNEAQIDGQSQALMALRNQYAAERHFASLGKLMDVAANNAANMDFAFSSQIAQKTTAQMVSELAYHLDLLSSNVANVSQGNGITHLYVTGLMKSRFACLSRDDFEPSGIPHRPGVYRLGRYKGLYEVYYTPKGLTEGATTTEILCIARSTDPARSPIVCGDAVPPIFLQLAVDKSMLNGSAFYTRNFTRINPHAPSAKSVGKLTLINTK